MSTPIHFPTFGWGLSLRRMASRARSWRSAFPHLRVGTFIEAASRAEHADFRRDISPPSGGDFH